MSNRIDLSLAIDSGDIGIPEVLKVKQDWHYVVITKGRNKTKKKISIPGDEHKFALKLLLQSLKNKVDCHKSVYSYLTGISYIDLVREHSNNEHLLKIDIKNFFDSISENDVKKCLQQYYEAELAKAISNYVCHENKLPFGSPFSPYFSNIYLKQLDQLLDEQCKNHSSVYTRYADDIYISSNDKHVLEGLLSKVINYLDNYYPNLKINNSKTIILSSPYQLGPFTVHNRQGVNLSKSYKRLTRVMLHKYSIDELEDEQELLSLKGLLLFVKGNDPQYFEKLNNKFQLEVHEIISLTC